MSEHPSVNASPHDPQSIQRMFNAIAPTYDMLNHLLSFGLDIRWRKRAIRSLEEKRGGAILDIAAGSGDLSLEALKLSPSYLVATDFAETMLQVFQKKLRGQRHSQIVNLVACDALSLPFADESFDATMVAFGIRNFADRIKSLREMRRVLKPRGLSLILELSAPKAPFVSQLYKVYSRVMLPLLGKIISKHNNAYAYLPDSIAKFPDQHEFRRLMEEAGFAEIHIMPLTFGAATIYLGRK
ncbi:MAG: bifunctional demethylmenaquinone methyltransferase/2-methoxy-6-polyprenyl-1,4-benzoquinol methylase UbiE [Ignavibacteriae bacterium]|nr:bifunctional demethylmenaquinone methyltransferase/2-methoxy-6-polyprenyl-1,4-benzoquinol methylase UbiE [Ignavibacteria bacterium]MBI3364048.1 bifunctional demethylmenaquinone methyltransferase/2-methoxy-6-polyprenyl-1,4-benzoquinol methylase UbiE [Ignavibacteriota bacterium]